MTTKMLRKFAITAVALAALGAVAGLTPASAEARAAKSVSQFAGPYDGYVPGLGMSWRLDIDSHGRIASVPAGIDSSILATFSGKVDSNGQMTCSGWWSAAFVTKRTFNFTASVVTDASGNIVGTTDKGETFVWYRLN